VYNVHDLTAADMHTTEAYQFGRLLSTEIISQHNCCYKPLILPTLPLANLCRHAGSYTYFRLPIASQKQ